MTEREKKERLAQLENEWVQWRRKVKIYYYLLESARKELIRIEKEIEKL